MNYPQFEELEFDASEEQTEEHQKRQDDYHTYTETKDDTVNEIWKKKHFPKIDDSIPEAYQTNYNFKETTESCYQLDDSGSSTQQSQKGEKRKTSNQQGLLDVDDAHNTNIYVTNLPTDITEQEFVNLMSKCGMIMIDPESGQFNIKLYYNDDGSLKGDGCCSYMKVESVANALSILDGYLYKGKAIHVERAKFQMKTSFDPSKNPRKKGKERENLKENTDNLFDREEENWRMRKNHEKVVIIYNMFDPAEFENDPSLVEEYQRDVREECSKCGEVQKVVVYDKNPEGIVSVWFKEIEQADECINMMNYRWFDNKQLRAECWDGRTKFSYEEFIE